MKATKIYESAKKEILNFVRNKVKQIYELEVKYGRTNAADVTRAGYHEINPFDYDIEVGPLFFCQEGTSYDDGVMYSLDSDTICVRNYNGEIFIVDEYDNERNLETDFPMESIVSIADALEKIADVLK